MAVASPASVEKPSARQSSRSMRPCAARSASAPDIVPARPAT
jgi:hypothetical protein